MIDYSAELNPAQLEVVRHGDGPCLVLAGAGSGKTRTITYRVAYLLEQGIKPEEILLVTFTNKAADEMVRRVEKLVGSGNPPLPPLGKGGGRLPWAGTFHKIARQLLIRYADKIGYPAHFTILDADDSKTLITLCAKEAKGGTDKSERLPSAGVMQGIISFAKNAEHTIRMVVEEKYDQWAHQITYIEDVARAYESRKKQTGVMDFDDLLTNTLLLLRQEERVRAQLSAQFRYILVDEYQDTNRVQASLVRLLVGAERNVLVVGDDAQSIYSFRAADVEHILQFAHDYPSAKVYKLETNYRSTPQIVALANDIIANNTRQYQKTLRAERAGGEKPLLTPAMDQLSEARHIVRKVQEHINEGTSPEDIAVLFRASHHSHFVELELTKAGIAYEYRGGLRFFERAHVKDVLAYMRLLHNLQDTSAWVRVLTREEGIGPSAAEKIIAVAKTATIETIGGLGMQVLPERARVGWASFLSVWNDLLSVYTSGPAEIIRTVRQSSYRDYVESEYLDSRERLNDLDQIAVFAEDFTDIASFLAETTLHESFARTDTRAHKTVLSTIHQAKGLEWDIVIVMNLSAGAFPNDRAAAEKGGLEEERRLFYVAITRARQRLYLTYPLITTIGDSAGPSVFLSEINSEYIEDKSILHPTSTVFADLSDADSDVRYVPDEDEMPPPKLRPGSFLREIEDL